MKRREFGAMLAGGAIGATFTGSSDSVPAAARPESLVAVPLRSGAHAVRRGATTTVLSVLPAINGTGPGCSQRRMAGRCAAAG